MTFLEILQDQNTNLPIKDNGKPFRQMLNEKITAFGNLIDQSKNLSGPINGTDFVESVFKERNQILRKGILSAIDAYYEGNPTKAYQTLSEALKKSHVTGYLDKRFELPTETNLYRIRIQDGNFPLSKSELFHIPFDLRGKVQTQRYSIPGLPSLYLANSLYVAWEEMKRPGFSDIQSIRIVNNRPLTMLDLTTDAYINNLHLENNEAYGWQLLYKVMTWPLVAACSVKVLNPSDTFKPEYIIPQLLLQWVNKETVVGIKYSSTHVSGNGNLHDGVFYNLVIPVRTFDKDFGHCEQLKDMFRTTQVVPIQLRQFISHTDRLAHQASIDSYVNRDISSIELIKGFPQPYRQSIFGVMEHTLKGLPLEDW